MPIFLLRRLLQSIATLLVMSLILFVGIYAIGDPTYLLIPQDATQEDIARTRAALGLDKEIWWQYFYFLKGALSGDLGKSFVHGVPAIALIVERMLATLELASAAMVFAIVFGLPLGLYAGLRPNGFLAQSAMVGSILGISLPTFWVSLMLILIFAVDLGWLPSDGRGPTQMVFGMRLSLFSREGWAHLVLPAFTLALFSLATIIRLTYSSTREALVNDYVKYARAKGLSNARVIGVHVLKNIMIPVITVTALQFGTLIAFTVVTESIFAWPGMGKLLIDAINMLDRPVIVAYLLIVVTMFIAINLVVDVLYSVLDPRVRLSEAKG